MRWTYPEPEEPERMDDPEVADRCAAETGVARLQEIEVSTLYIKRERERERLALHLGLRSLSPFWAEEQGPLANSALSCPKLGRLNLVLAGDLVVRLP